MHCATKISRNMKKLILCTLSIICFTLCLAQNNYPIIEKDGQKFYEYTILQGDGLFAIARKFGVKQTDLHSANENLSTEIKAGDKILIPIKENTSKKIENALTTHIVEAKQTLYSISRLYNVPVDTLIALNPNTKNGIKIGETLIISTNKKLESKQSATEKNTETKENNPNDITHIVQKKETLFSISKKYNIAIHDLIELNPELKDGLKAGTTIIIKKGKSPEIPKHNITTKQEAKDSIAQHVVAPKVKPLPITTKNNKENKKNKSENHTNLNIAYLLPLVANNSNEEKNNQRFIEFYRGSLIALQNAKNNGISANVYTYNVTKNTTQLDSILADLNDKSINLLIGPAYSEQLDKVLAYTKEHDIATIVPFSNKIDSQYYYPNLLQFNPPQDSLFVSVLENTFAHRNLQYILTHFENCTNKGEIFTNNLKKLLIENNKEFKEMTLKPEFVDSLTQMIGSDTTILVLGSSRINDVAPILDSLNKYQLPLLQVWGFEDWGTNIIKKYPQTIYYSLFYPRATPEYEETYKAWFGSRVQTVSAQYDLLGYDLTTFALNGISITNNNINFNTTYPSSNYLQSYPTFEFLDGRWLNTNYYLLFWDNISIKKINK